MTKAEQCAENLAWWREHGPAAVRADRAISSAARAGDSDREGFPGWDEVRKLRAVREAFAAVPQTPDFTPAHTVRADVGMTEPTMTAAGRLFDLEPYTGEEPAGIWERDGETVGASDSDVQSASLRHSAFVWHCKNRAGEVQPEEIAAAAERGQAELRENSLNMALALASAGIPAFLPSSAPRASIVDPAEGSERKIDLAPLRRINFLPTIAKARRAPVVLALEAFAARNGRCRMATFTAGRNLWVTGDGAELRARVMWFNRRISNLNASALFRSHGVQMQFRADEFGTIRTACPWPRVPGTEAGAALVHLHCHVVYTLAHQLSPRRWRRFLAKVRNKWRFHWGENGRLENIREACKYPIKPGDCSHLSNESLAAFYRGTAGLHLVQPLGEFREEIRERRAALVKLRRQRTAKQELKLTAGPDWNASAMRLSDAEKSARAAYREQMRRRGLSVFIKASKLLHARDSLLVVLALILRERGRGRTRRPFLVASEILAAVARLDGLARVLVSFCPRPFEERRLAGLRRMKEDAAAGRHRRPMKNRICARLGPAPYFDRITRPALLVWNFDGNFAALRAEPFVAEYLAAVRPQIERAEQAVRFLKVHTSHATAGRDSGGVPLLETAEAWSAPPPALLVGRN